MRLYNRQKLLLNLLAASGDRLGSTDLQKLLFLFVTKWDVDAGYGFVPHRYGCYSFQAAADLQTLEKKECVTSDSSSRWQLTETGKTAVLPADVGRLKVFVNTTVPERGDALIARIYLEYPYFACRSGIVDRIISDPDQQKAIREARPKAKGSALFTIGYEGDSIDGYLERLIRHNVKLLCDVRKNPLSRKTGFSKKSLVAYCEKVDISYVHLPDLGIPGHRRRELNTRADYDALFEEYEREDLPQAGEALATLGDLLKKHKRIALTCFEKEPEECHRHCVAEELQRLLGNCPEPQHI